MVKRPLSYYGGKAFEFELHQLKVGGDLRLGSFRWSVRLEQPIGNNQKYMTRHIRIVTICTANS